MDAMSAGPIQLCEAISMSRSAMRPAGTSPRHATQPVKRGFSGPKDELAHATMDAVGADHQVGFGRRTVVEARRHPLAPLLQADQPVADMQSSRRQGVSQQLGQVSAMKVIVGRAELCLDLGTERRPLQGAAIVPAPLMHRERAHADGVHRRLSPS